MPEAISNIIMGLLRREVRPPRNDGAFYFIKHCQYKIPRLKLFLRLRFYIVGKPSLFVWDDI